MSFDEPNSEPHNGYTNGNSSGRSHVVDARACTGGPEARKKLVPWLEKVRKTGETDSELDVSLIHLDGPRDNEVWSDRLAFDEEVSTFVSALIDEAESRCMSRRGTCAFVVRVQGTNFSRQFELVSKRSHEDMDPWTGEAGYQGSEFRDVIALLLENQVNDRRMIYQLVRDTREDARETLRNAQRTVEMYQKDDLENRALTSKMLKNEKIIEFQIEERRKKREQGEKMMGMMTALGLRAIADRLGIQLPPMMIGPPPGGGPPGAGGAGGAAGMPRIPIQAKFVALMKTLEGSDIEDRLSDEQKQIIASIAGDVMEWQAAEAQAQQQAQNGAGGPKKT